MRIVGVETLRLATLPNLVFVVLHTDSGVTGLGETYYGAAAVEVVVHETLAPMLLASPMPRSAAEIGAAIDAGAFYVGTTGSGVEVRARSAIDIALWDLASRARGVSLATLAGDPQRGDLPVYNTCAGPHYMRDPTGQRSLNWGLPSDGQRHRYDDLWSFLNQADRLADDLLADGISAMKIWPFDSPAEATRGESISASAMAAALAPVRRIREAVGDRMQILIEMHGLWQPRPAAQILGELEHYDVMWAEDPIPPHRIEELAALRAGCRIPIAAGETVGTTDGAAALVRGHAVDVLITDLGWCGGVSGALAQASLAATAGIGFALHDCSGPVVLATSVHLATCLPHMAIQETTRSYYADWYPALVTGLPRLENGRIFARQDLGHGLTLRPDLRARPDLSHRLTGHRGNARIVR
jgi:L-alanine-DL-glutamate epimerase-like enolase superfamily enzyme